jgi:hypothetical protein
MSSHRAQGGEVLAQTGGHHLVQRDALVDVFESLGRSVTSLRPEITAAVAAETRIWPPQATAQMREPRCTSGPT